MDAYCYVQYNTMSYVCKFNENNIKCIIINEIVITLKSYHRIIRAIGYYILGPRYVCLFYSYLSTYVRKNYRNGIKRETD